MLRPQNNVMKDNDIISGIVNVIEPAFDENTHWMHGIIWKLNSNPIIVGRKEHFSGVMSFVH